MKLTLATLTLLLSSSLAYPESFQDSFQDSYPSSFQDSYPSSYPSSFQDSYPSSYPDSYQDYHTDSYPDYYPDSHTDYHPDSHPDYYQDSHPDSHPIYPIYYPENGQKLKCYGSDGWKALVSGNLEEESCFSRCYAATGNEPINKYILGK
jgi:hypothetical protein